MKTIVWRIAAVNPIYILFIILFNCCQSKSQDNSLTFPVNCSPQEITGKRLKLMNGEISLIIPEKYTAYQDTLIGDFVSIFRIVSYKPDKGVAVDIFKTDQKTSYNTIKANIRSAVDSLDIKDVYNSDYQINELDGLEYFVFTYAREFDGDKTVFSQIYFKLDRNIYGVWISHFEAIEDFDYKGYCEIINILATIRKEE